MKCFRIFPEICASTLPRSGKIDAEHRARQHLRYGAFGDDWSFLRHRGRTIRGNAQLSRLPQLI